MHSNFELIQQQQQQRQQQAVLEITVGHFVNGHPSKSLNYINTNYYMAS